MDAMLEHVLLAQLRHAPLTRAELVRRTGAADRSVQAALDQLAEETFVVRRSQQGMPAEYELTAAGVIRLKVVAELLQSPSAAIGKAVGGMITAAVVEGARRRPPPALPSTGGGKLLLSDADRSLCSEALAEQFSLGRIGKTELDRRTDLLYAARDRRQLGEIFDGLPMPTLDEPSVRAAGSPRWRMAVFTVVAVLSVPFLLLGGLIMVSNPNLTAFLVGSFCFAGALAWDYFAWSWATRGRRDR